MYNNGKVQKIYTICILVITFFIATNVNNVLCSLPLRNNIDNEYKIGLGIDISDALKQDDWKCLKTNSDLSWAVVRAYHSFGAFDNSSLTNLKNANDAGIENVDVYMFPCSGKDPTMQVKDLLSKLKDSNFQTVWLDIEENPSPGCSWSMQSNESNCQFVEKLFNEVTQAGAAVGIYSSHYEWTKIMGEDCKSANHLPLWYAHYDKENNCDDFSRSPSFGGWTKAFAKQFNDNVVGEKSIDACIDGRVPADIDVLCNNL